MMADVEKIKRNVGKMIDLNAPEQDIDAYLSTEGFTPETFRAAVKPVTAQVPSQQQPDAPNGITAMLKNEMGIKPDTLTSRSDSGYLSGITDQALQGASLGFADEVGAAGAGTGGAIVAALRGQNPLDAFSQSYDRRLGEIRGADKSFHAAHPVASTVAQLAGGGVLAGPTTKAIAAAPATLPQMIGRGAATGAGYGGVAGFGSGEGGFENRAASGGMGAAIGALFGGAIPAVSWGIGKGYQLGQRMLGLQDPDREASLLLGRALSRDELTPQELLARSTAAGDKPVSIADIAGRNTRRLADQTSLQGGPGAERLNTFLDERQAGQGSRVLDDIKANLAPSTDTYGLTDDLTAKAKAAAAPLYEKAYGAGNVIPDEVWSDDIARLMERPSMKQALGRAYRIAAEEGRDPRTLGFDFNDAGDVIFKDKVPTMQTLDYVKRGLDDVLESLRDPVSGRLVLDESGRAINATRAAFRDQLKTLNPDYAAALQAYAGPAQQKQAVSLGGDFLKLDPEQISMQIGRMSPDEQQAFKVGAARSLQDQIDRVKGMGDVTGRIFNDPRVKKQIEAAFGEQAYKDFSAVMQLEKAMAETRKFVSGNSRTAERLIGADDVGQQIAENFLRGGKQGVVSGLVDAGLTRARGINDPTGIELSSLFSAATPTDRAAVVGKIGSEVAKNNAGRLARLRAAMLANSLLAEEAGLNLPK